MAFLRTVFLIAVLVLGWAALRGGFHHASTNHASAATPPAAALHVPA